MVLYQYVHLHVVSLRCPLRQVSWAAANEVPLSNCYPAGIYMFKVNNRNTRLRCKISSKLTIKA